MAARYDLVIRGGAIADGTGGPLTSGDIAVLDGHIAAIGSISGSGREEIDARHVVVTPGFVDAQTHYDGQVTWENRLSPSSLHGVTTAVMGNCGVGFAPCRPEDRATLTKLMEGVEEIPGPVINAGVPWSWETFPDYLDFLGGRSYDMDIAGYVPHAALRLFVMGERAMRGEMATAEDRQSMHDALRAALRAGALGFGTSQTMFHRSSDGQNTPSFKAGEDELASLSAALTAERRGIIQHVTDWDDFQPALDRMERLARNSGRKLTFTLTQHHNTPNRWREILAWITRCRDDGVDITGQIMPRPIGLIFGLTLTLNPFYMTDTYQALLRVSLEERVAAMRQPDMRARIMGETMRPDESSVLGTYVRKFETMFRLGATPDYEPDPANSIAAEAARLGKSPEDHAYDLMLEDDGRAMLYLAFMNYADHSLAPSYEMLRHPGTIPALGDGGAHFGTICDASYTSFMLSHWARDRAGPKLDLPEAVHLITQRPANLVGLTDRGVLAPGMRADFNVLDPDRIAISRPELRYDLPAGGRRLMQRAEGYEATIVAGTPTYRRGEETGALPGRLVRGAVDGAPIDSAGVTGD